MILGIGRRTVEDYIKKLKLNFSCSKTSQLIYMLVSLGLKI
jgi:hypothetical protein